MKSFDSVIFALDGTLWSTIDSCVKTLNEARKKHPDITREVSKEAADYANIPFAYASYGFGKVDKYNFY